MKRQKDKEGQARQSMTGGTAKGYWLYWLQGATAVTLLCAFTFLCMGMMVNFHYAKLFMVPLWAGTLLTLALVGLVDFLRNRSGNASS